MLQKQIQKLLDKPMDRREFLTCLAQGALIITGVSATLRGMLKFTEDPGHKAAIVNQARAAHGFGSSRFGI